MDKYRKIRKWLGHDYHLSVGVEPNKPDKWSLYKCYNDRDLYFCNKNKPIMTSERHTYKQLYNFAKKTHVVNIPLLNCKVRIGIATITLILATINLFMGNTILRVIIYTSNTIIITESLIHAIGLSKNAKALKTRMIFERNDIRIYCDDMTKDTPTKMFENAYKKYSDMVKNTKMRKRYIVTKDKPDQNIKEVITAIGQNIIDRADEVSKNCENVSKITISADITPDTVVDYSINKTYYATIDVKENEAKNEN